jgi:RND superfamily putative drug exporter
MLTRLVWNRTVPTLIASLLLLVVFAVLGFRVFSVLIGGGYADPASESARAQQIVHEEVGGEANMVVLVRAPKGSRPPSPPPWARRLPQICVSTTASSPSMPSAIPA